MTDHEPGTTLRAMLARTANRYATQQANSDLVLNETTTEALALLREGMLADELPDGDELLRSHIHTILRASLNRESRMVKRKVSAGSLQRGFDLGMEFEATITVCGKDALSQFHGIEHTSGRIVTLGALTATDVRLMALEQDINLAKQIEAHRRDQPLFAAFADTLARYGGYRAYKMSLRGTA